MSDCNQRIYDNFIQNVLTGNLPDSACTLTPDDVGLTATELVDLFESQLMSRHLDLQSRLMQKQGNSFYTIGSAGHEGSAAYAKAFRPTDMAFLHYRSGAFFNQRSKQVAGQTPIYDLLLSFSAAKDDPISGGRHKVFGSKALSIPPQTSTIASHLPKAMGAAFSVTLANRLNFKGNLPNDAVILCSFGDASANHSTSLGAINSTAWASYQSTAMPIVYICEDNGVGISTRTPSGWIAQNFQHRPGIHYIACDGLNLLDTYQKAKQAENLARQQGKAVFLHMKTVRLLGHAGSDVETSYRDREEIAAIEFQDPLLHSARILLEHNILTKKTIVELYQHIAERVACVAKQVVSKARLQNADEVKASLIPPMLKSNTRKSLVSQADRTALFAHEKHNLGHKQHMAKLLNWTLMDLMAEYQHIVLCGEDIGRKGGVYSVTSKLSQRFGTNRVVNTLLDEQSILGLAIGLAHNGFLPIAEIQFLAYVHNAEDQIRGEAATLPFFSDGQFTNPMVIRVAGLAYQKGFGGHFHNDNSFAVFRDIPGVIIACPSNGTDAVIMLRQCVQLAVLEQRVVVFLEPIALYMTKDLHQAGDGLWTSTYLPPDNKSAVFAEEQPLSLTVSVTGTGTELAIISYGNGYYLARQAEKQLAEQGITCRVIDLRWLAPLDKKGIIEQASLCKHVLIVDECRQTGSISEALMTLLLEASSKCSKMAAVKLARLCAEDSFIPLGAAAYHVLPSVSNIVAAGIDLVAKRVDEKVLND